MMDKLFGFLIFLLMLVVLLFAFPIAIVSVGWNFGKEVVQGKKPKFWGMG